MTEKIASYEEVLRLLTAKAGEGSVSAMVALERALRPERPEPEDEVGATIDRILAQKRREGADLHGKGESQDRLGDDEERRSIMAVVLVQDGPTVTQERYDEVVRRMTGKDRMESPSDWPVEGLLVHATGQGPDGFRIVDVWESEEACNRFGEALAPHLEAAGITNPPQIYQAHTFVSA